MQTRPRSSSSSSPLSSRSMPILLVLLIFYLASMHSSLAASVVDEDDRYEDGYETITRKHNEAPSDLETIESQVEGGYAALTHNKDYAHEIHYLLEQQVVFWEKERRILQAAGFQDGMNVADIGCGPGHTSELILEWLPNSKVSCFELDKEFAKAASERMKPYIEQGRFTVYSGANATKLPTEIADATFDAVVSRLLYQHLPNPDAAAREAYRILKPDGVIAIIDADESLYDHVKPTYRELDTLQREKNTYLDSIHKYRSNSKMGRQLHPLLKKIGFDRLLVEVAMATNIDTPTKHFLPLVDTYQFYPLVQQKVTTPEQLKRLQRKIERDFLYWNKSPKRPKPVIFMYVFVVTGRKPQELVIGRKTTARDDEL